MLQRASLLKLSPSLTMWDAQPVSCPSRRGHLCFCTSGLQKTGGRAGTTASTAWCLISTLLCRTCEYQIQHLHCLQTECLNLRLEGALPNLNTWFSHNIKHQNLAYIVLSSSMLFLCSSGAYCIFETHRFH